MKAKRKLNLILSAAILLATLAGCGMLPDNETVEETPVVMVDNSIVSATGMIVPAQYAYLSLPGAGSVDQVAVYEGQTVSENQSLLTLSSLAQIEASKAAAELELEAAQQTLDELYEKANLAKASAWLALLDAKAQYIIAEEEWENLDTDDLQDDIDNAQEDIIEYEEDLEEAQDNFDNYADMDETNALRQRYEDELQEAQEAYNERIRERDVLVIQMESAEARWKSAQAALQQAQADYDALADGPDPDRVALAEARLTNAVAQIEAAQEQIDNRTLTAPFAGVIADLMISAGEWANPGQPVALLADLNSLRVETTDLNELDVVQIEIGDKAAVTFDAIPDKVFQGTISEISPMAAMGSGVNYTVVIELDERPDGVRWGMTVFVDIDTDQ
jgi:multidrug efflux pump subunit AcrA (membrane-fusion protein)